jgi:hemerythrin-like domain-containing protein
MDHERQIARLLHEEHVNTLAVLDRFETALRANRKAPPAVPSGDPDFSRALREMRGLVTDEVGRHFDFEEQELFPRLAQFGDAAMGELLSEEHRTLLDAGGRLATDCDDLLDGAFDAAAWKRFQRDAMVFVETMTGHIQKEEMGLLMALEAMLDPETDQELTMAYSENQAA